MPPRMARKHVDDAVLIEAIAEGDRLAMHELFVRHNARVYRFVLRMVGNTAMAEDLVNEVFLDVWRKSSGFEQRSKVSTWLLAIARFKALRAMRRQPDEDVDEWAIEQVEDRADNAEDLLERNQRSMLLRRCLAQVSPAHREVIDLVYYHEKSIAEAGEIIGIPQATVKTRMFYARQRLGELLRQAEAGMTVA